MRAEPNDDGRHSGGGRDAPRVRILLVDDHRLFSDGVRMLLEQAPEIEVAAIAETAEHGLELAAALHPDVVLMDVDLPGMGGIEATRILVAMDPAPAVVALSAFQQGEVIADALEAGAAAYVPKTHAPEELIGAIRLAASGGSSLSPAHVDAVLARLRQRVMTTPQPAVGHDLTARERDVLRRLVDGQSVSDVATELHVSVFTVRGHVRGLLSKLGVRSMTQAVALVLREGLLDRSADLPPASD
jgi:DNA-binding NarL/FixJ family response regulator